MTDAETEAVFRCRWSALASISPVDPHVWNLTGERLLARHQEDHRRYHGVRHIVAVLEVLDTRLELPTPLPAALALAAFFHDAIYDPQASDNEAASAVLARGELNRLWIPAPVIADTLAMIEATARHEPDETQHCGAFLDADLSILGTDPRIYERYAVAIREEYAHVPDVDFNTGRARILEGFLQRDSLYFTAAGQQAFEAQARTNLADEVTRLRC